MKHLLNFFRVKRTSNNYVFYYSNVNYKLYNSSKKINYNIDYKLHTIDYNYIKKLYNIDHVVITNDKNKVIKYNLLKLYFIMRIFVFTKLVSFIIMYNNLCTVL